MGGNIAHDTLGVDNQKPDLSICQSVEIDDASPAALATACNGPTNLATTTTTRDHVPYFGIGCEPGTERAALLLRPDFPGILREGRCFDDRVHSPDHTSMT